jgi:hypothetical protein
MAYESVRGLRLWRRIGYVVREWRPPGTGFRKPYGWMTGDAMALLTDAKQRFQEQGDSQSPSRHGTVFGRAREAVRPSNP